MIRSVLSLVKFVKQPHTTLIECLHSQVAVNLLVILSVIVSFKQFGGRPIECIIPEHNGKAWEEYAENYCWAANTYYVKPCEYVEQVLAEARKGSRQISYYQWVPFFLLFQALSFRLPSIFWNVFGTSSAVKIFEIINMAKKSNILSTNERKANVLLVAEHLKSAKVFQPFRAYLTVGFLITKLSYLVNGLLQLLLLHMFMQTVDKISLWNLFTCPPEAFPLVTFCDFQVHNHANNENNTVQCLLAINVLNEKIFFLLSYGYLFLSLAALINMFYWMLVIGRPVFKNMLYKSRECYSFDDVLIYKLVGKRFSKELNSEMN